MALAYTDPVLPADLQANYAGLRLERGQTWEEMGRLFERDGEQRLARWAIANGRAEAEQRGAAAPLGRSATAPEQQVAAAEPASPEQPLEPAAPAEPPAPSAPPVKAKR